MTQITTRPRPDSAPEPPAKEPFLGLTLPQLLGGALAAITSALAASVLGVAGTLIGAALGSVLVTVASALYSHTLTTAGSTLRAGARRAVPSDGRGEAAPPRSTDAFVTAAAPRTGGSGRPARRTRSLRRLSVAVAAVFLLALAGLTLAEQLLGRPVSASTGGGTTLSRVIAPQSSEQPAAEDRPADSQSGSQVAPQSDPTGQPTAPAGQQDDAPGPAGPGTTPAPDQPTPGGTATVPPEPLSPGGGPGTAVPDPGVSAGG